jgi:hypothetical protein
MVRRDKTALARARPIVARHDSATNEKTPCGSVSALQQNLIKIKVMA